MANHSSKHFGTLFQLYFREDIPRDVAREHWKGPHAELVARNPGVLEYRQHHFAARPQSEWLPVDGIDTTVSPSRRIDGMPEVTFATPVAPLLGGKVNVAIKADESTVFARTLMNVTGFTGIHWRGSSSGVGARTVVLLRARQGAADKVFAAFVDGLAERLFAQPGLTEVRSGTFRRWTEKGWATPGVAHDNPVNEQFHAFLILGSKDRAQLGKALRATLANTEALQRRHLSAAHTYQVEETFVFRRENRITKPSSHDGPSALKQSLAHARHEMPVPPPRSSQTESTTPFPSHRFIQLPGSGPEDIIADGKGRLYTGLADGRILAIDEGAEVTVIGDTGGRPLGLELDRAGNLIICDAHRGLLRLELSTGNITTLASYIEGVPLRFCSNAAVTDDGAVWFTESTNRFDYEHYLGSLLEHRPSGRLFRLDPDGTVDVVLEDLYFANGLTVTPDGSALLLAETAAARITRIPLVGRGTGRPTVVANNLPGYPDNLSAFRNGRTWAGIPGPRNAGLEKLGTAPSAVAKAVWAFSPGQDKKPASNKAWIMAFDEQGAIVTDLQTAKVPFTNITGAVESAGSLYCVSTFEDRLLVIDVP